MRLVRLMQGMVKESKKEKNGDFSLLVECKGFFESEFVGFEVYCIRFSQISETPQYSWLGDNVLFF